MYVTPPAPGTATCSGCQGCSVKMGSPRRNREAGRDAIRVGIIHIECQTIENWVSGGAWPDGCRGFQAKSQSLVLEDHVDSVRIEDQNLP